MDLAKPALDLGLGTNDLEASLAFWQGEVGLAFQEVLPLGGGLLQHRHGLHGGVLKLNHAKEPVGQAPTGLAVLTIATSGAAEARPTRSPEGIEVVLVPPGHDGVDAVEVAVDVADEAAARRFWVEGVGCAEEPDGRLRLGETLLRLRHAPGRERTGPLQAEGFRYLTVQVRDVHAEHARLLGLGVEEGMAPVVLGEVAAISMVRTPDGDWLEVSQRRSLVGDLPR